ncbi:MAG: acyl carrier protein [Gemmataceae bacterium]
MDDLERITAAISEIGKIPAVAPEQDIYDAGFSSVNALQLLFELEAFGEVSIPDEEFVAARTPRQLQEMLTRLRQEQQVGV